MGTSTITQPEVGDSTRRTFSWRFPGSPICINIPISVVSRLRADLDQRVDLSGSAPRAEVGGVLLGRSKTPGTLDIEDYVWLPSDERQDGRYLLATSELAVLRAVYTAPVVGYFRTQAGEELQLRDEEVRLVQEHFADPTNVVLLIRPSRVRCTAGFFFWMPEGIFTPHSFMDFALDDEPLRPRPRLQRPPALIVQPHEKVEISPALPARMDDIAAHNAAAPPKSVSAQFDEVAPKSLEPAKAGLPVQSPLQPLPASHRDFKTAPAPESQSKIEPVVAARPRTAATPKEAPAPNSQRMLLLATGALIAVLPLIAVFAALARNYWSPRANQAVRATAAAFPLQLNVQAEGNGLNIRWNPQSSFVTEAREGRLVVLGENKRPQIIPLAPQQLISGHIYYRSLSRRLEFQMEVVDNSGRVTRESVLVLPSKPEVPAPSRLPRSTRH